MHPKIHRPTESAIAHAADALLHGHLVGLPTETVYGLAARGDDALAVEQIFVAKGRPRHNPLILHVADADAARRLFADHLSSIQRSRLSGLKTFWPGPLTLIVPKHPSILDAVTAGGDTVAVRVPDHPVALSVLREMSRQNGSPVPVAAPSANVSNYVSPTTASHVAEGLGDQVAMILDGGSCRVGLESTIVFLGTEDSPPRILRSGRLGQAELAARLGEPLTGQQHPQPASALKESHHRPVAAPGQFAKHYSPRAEVFLLPIDSSADPPPGTLHIGFDPIALSDAGSDARSNVWTFAPDGRLETAAANLYLMLRRADQQNYRRIEVVACPEQGIGIAIMDRLRRAASGD